MIQFCPNCWKETGENAVMCRNCMYDLTQYNQLSYEEKLILAMKHPVRENRMLAIQLLGDLRSIISVPVFEGILRNENDFYTIRAIVFALRKIGGNKSESVLTPLKKHRSKLVRGLIAAGDDHTSDCEGLRD